MSEVSEHTSTSRMGVTHAIRSKLNFLDERLWKRFSARRLELIDNLDLSLRKASEQEDQIREVAELLRSEFKYTDEYKPDFDKLVRAAIQSVRRNRKRSSRSKRSDDAKRQKVRKGEHDPRHYTEENDLDEFPEDTETDTQFSDNGPHHNNAHPEKFDQFLSEIVKIKSENNQLYDMTYSTAKHFTDTDKAKVAIDSMIKPRSSVGFAYAPTVSNLNTNNNLNNNNTNPLHEGAVSGRASVKSDSSIASQTLPPISNLQITNIQDNGVDAFSAKATLIHYIERSRSCCESLTRKSDNLKALGEAAISASISYIFEKSFGVANEASIEYLRSKLNNEAFLAKFFRGLDPKNSVVADGIAVISLCTILGGCIKDFGFESILLPMCEIFYVSILHDYPLIAKNSIPFKGAPHRSGSAINEGFNYSSRDSFTSGFPEAAFDDGRNSLNSLAAVATDLQMHQADDHEDKTKKSVSLRFLSSVLEFLYPTRNSAPPRYVELLENACSYFKLNMNDTIVGLKNSDGTEIRGDLDLERIFKTQQVIELEIFTQRPKAIPVYELPSAVIPSHHQHLYPEPQLKSKHSQFQNPQPFMKHPLIQPSLQQLFESSTPGSARITLPLPVMNIPSLTRSRCESEVIPHSSHHQYGPSMSSSSSATPSSFNFLSNNDTPPPPPPPPLLPRFQPLL